MCPQRRLTQEEGKVATIIVTLPVRFRGGALTVHDFEGNEEKYYGRGGKPGSLEWTAFLADCDHEIETVKRGVRLMITYTVFMRTFGPSPSPSESLMLPSEHFLDLICPVLNASRGQTIAFYLREQYGFSPAEVLAETLVPHVSTNIFFNFISSPNFITFVSSKVVMPCYILLSGYIKLYLNSDGQLVVMFGP